MIFALFLLKNVKETQRSITKNRCNVDITTLENQRIYWDFLWVKVAKGSGEQAAAVTVNKC